MTDIYLFEVVGKATNPYELVMALKEYKNQGYKYVLCGNKPVPLGKLMYKIVDMSKAKYSMEQIKNEIEHEFCL